VFDHDQEETEWMRQYMESPTSTDKKLVWHRFNDCVPLIHYMAGKLSQQSAVGALPEPKFVGIAPFACFAVMPQLHLQSRAEDIHEEAKGTYKDLVGVHIRRGDLKRMFKQQYGCGREVLGREDDMKLLADLLEYIQENDGGSTAVFIACDSHDTYDWLHSSEPLRAAIAAKAVRFHPVHEGGWNAKSDTVIADGLRETSQQTFIEEMLVVSMCERVTLTASSTATMLIQALRKKPFHVMKFAGTSKPKACTKAFCFPEMKDPVTHSLNHFGGRLQRLQGKPVGGICVLQPSQVSNAHSVASKSQVPEAARKFLHRVFSMSRDPALDGWMASTAMVMQALRAEVDQDYMKPLKQWLSPMLEGTCTTDRINGNRIVHLLVNIVSRMRQPCGQRQCRALLRFIAMDEMVYSVNWTALSAETWNKLHSQGMTQMQVQCTLTSVRWNPMQPCPSNTPNFQEDVWSHAFCVMDLYQQGIKGQELLNALAIDDVVPARGTKRAHDSTSSRTAGAASSTARPYPENNARPPLARSGTKTVLDLILCNCHKPYKHSSAQ
jgi:hypothetical protein